MSEETNAAPGQSSTSSGVEAKLEAALRLARPRVKGTVVSEDRQSVILKAGDAILEVPARYVEGRSELGGEVELQLAPDTHLLVSAVVSARDGFIGDNVFGPLLDGLLADNCNCNCNCGGGGSIVQAGQVSELRRPFTGGARRQSRSD